MDERTKGDNLGADEVVADPELLEKFIELEDSQGGILNAVEALLRAKLLELQGAYEEYLRTRQALFRLMDKQVPETQNPDDFALSLAGKEVGMPSGPSVRKPVGKRKESILKLVEEFPGVEVWKIAEVEGISPSRVSQIVSALVEEGRLQRTDAGLRVV
jgi:hypothetical protein